MSLAHFTTTQTNSLEVCLQLLGSRYEANLTHDGLIVQTDVLLPNWNRCVVVIEGSTGGNRIVVSDGGAAFSSVLEGGFDLNSHMLSASKRTASKLGVSCDFGVVQSPAVPIEDVRQAVILTANAMRDIANVVWEVARKHNKVRFRERVFEQLNSIFRDSTIKTGAKFVGASTDVLRFDYSISSRSRILLVDAPIPEGGSIASVVLRHTDVRKAHLDNVRQAIVFDEADKWSSANLSQLQLADVPVFSQRTLESGLSRLVI